ncbi:REPIN1 isoform 18, partial [Pongo abelii]
MGIGVSLLLQFSLTPGGHRSVGRSRRCSRGSIPRNIPKRSWKKPHPQLCSLQALLIFDVSQLLHLLNRELSVCLSSLTELLCSSDVAQ